MTRYEWELNRWFVALLGYSDTRVVFRWGAFAEGDASFQLIETVGGSGESVAHICRNSPRQGTARNRSTSQNLRQVARLAFRSVSG
jgi:hypothetical protein